MTARPPAPRLGFFTRLLDAVPAGTRYRLAAEQIRRAEELGFDSAWVAQHHFTEGEGGLPSPLVFLSHVAATTSRIRLGTGIITLPLEDPVRVAEDAAVLDLLADGRLEVGVGSGGTASSFPPFGQESANRAVTYAENLEVLRTAWAGLPLGGDDTTLYPPATGLVGRVWQATFSVAGGARAGAAGDGLMLSRTQPRPADAPHATLWELQEPIIDAYLEALPTGVPPRILGSRSVFVADDRDEARRFADVGLRRQAEALARGGLDISPAAPLDDLIAAVDTHLGTPDDVLASLTAAKAFEKVTDVSFQVHSVDPPHEHILRSIELIATKVAPEFGWTSSAQRTAQRTAQTTARGAAGFDSDRGRALEEVAR